MSITSVKRFISSTGICTLLSLLFLASSLTACGALKGRQKKKRSEVEYRMTVARVIPAAPGDAFIEVTFSESQRFYKLPKNTNPKYIDMLKEAERSGTPVMIKRASEQSDVIVSVSKARQ